jgi:hypothetical protein
MISFRIVTGIAVAAALAAATPAYAVLNHNGLAPNALIQNAFAAVGTALEELSSVAVEGAAVSDGVGGVLVADDWKGRM